MKNMKSLSLDINKYYKNIVLSDISDYKDTDNIIDHTDYSSRNIAHAAIFYKYGNKYRTKSINIFNGYRFFSIQIPILKNSGKLCFRYIFNRVHPDLPSIEFFDKEDTNIYNLKWLCYISRAARQRKYDMKSIITTK